MRGDDCDHLGAELSTTRSKSHALTPHEARAAQLGVSARRARLLPSTAVRGVSSTRSLTRARPRAAWLRRYAPWIAATGVATLGAAALDVGGFTGFQRFIGSVPPTITVAAAGAAGLGALVLLENRGFRNSSSTSRTSNGIGLAVAATIPFAVVAIGVDATMQFPRDTNVALPEAWLLYPAIAVVAETAFHLLPLASLVWLTRSHFTDLRLDRRTWALVLTAAAVEPVAQAALGSAHLGFVIPHVYAIGVAELLLLRRYGYVPMLSFRICYYLIWHVLWGHARLMLLF